MPYSLGDLIEVAAVHQFGAVDEVISVYHVHVDVLSEPSDTAVWIDMQNLMDELYTLIEGQMTTDTDATELRIRNVTDDGPQAVVPWLGIYTGGTSTGENLPPGTCPLILLRTGVKRVQGRKYLPSFAEATQDAGVWTAGVLGVLGTFGGYLEGQHTGVETTNEYTFHVYSRTLGLDYPIIATTARPTVAYQRRRKQGKGS